MTERQTREGAEERRGRELCPEPRPDDGFARAERSRNAFPAAGAIHAPLPLARELDTLLRRSLAAELIEDQQPLQRRMLVASLMVVQTEGASAQVAVKSGSASAD